MSLLDTDRRIAHAATIAGYDITKSGLVVCEQKHINTTYGAELSRQISEVVKEYTYVFLDLLGAETIVPSYAERLGAKAYGMVIDKEQLLVLVDPSEKIVETIFRAQRENGRGMGTRSLFTINPNPEKRISQ